MKPLLKYILYVLVIVLLVVGSLMIYRVHPEAQLAFLIPGVLILAYSRLSDDLGLNQHSLRVLRGR